MGKPSPDEMLAALTQMFPDFDHYWRTEGCFLEESGWSDTPYHSLCGDFSSYIREHILSFDDAKMHQLCDYIEQFVIEDGDEEEIDNAVCTCFLENIGGNPIENQLRPYLKPKSLRFHQGWHG